MRSAAGASPAFRGFGELSAAGLILPTKDEFNAARREAKIPISGVAAVFVVANEAVRALVCPVLTCHEVIAPARRAFDRVVQAERTLWLTGDAAAAGIVAAPRFIPGDVFIARALAVRADIAEDWTIDLSLIDARSIDTRDIATTRVSESRAVIVVFARADAPAACVLGTANPKAAVRILVTAHSDLAAGGGIGRTLGEKSYRDGRYSAKKPTPRPAGNERTSETVESSAVHGSAFLRILYKCRSH